jgi:S1-C subfamily serine protease
MRRASLYSSSRAAVPDQPVAPTPVPGQKEEPAFRGWLRRHRSSLLAVLPGLVALGIVLGQTFQQRASVPTTQEDIDAAVEKSLESVPLPSTAAKAYEAVQGSIVRVKSYTEALDGSDAEMGAGTGVVILDRGVILTNIHVVDGASRIRVIFSDGLETEADLTGAKPQDDLAVLQAHAVPDDLQAATIQSTSGLALGDHVTAVGFPFGIGPSVSSGVVSGLGREYRSPEGTRLLRNLIQFDAAVNPGNSGGALVNSTGEVVGIVTGLMNPTGQRVFIGLGFAVPIENAAMAVGLPPF